MVQNIRWNGAQVFFNNAELPYRGFRSLFNEDFLKCIFTDIKLKDVCVYGSVVDDEFFARSACVDSKWLTVDQAKALCADLDIPFEHIAGRWVTVERVRRVVKELKIEEITPKDIYPIINAVQEEIKPLMTWDREARRITGKKVAKILLELIKP